VMSIRGVECAKCEELKHYPIDEIHELHTQLAELSDALNCAEAKARVLSKRKPTKQECDAAESISGVCVVGEHCGKRCTACNDWVLDGGSMHLGCVLASNADYQFSRAKKAHEEAQHLVRKLSDVLLCLELREP
jgi:hypothetical protein